MINPDAAAAIAIGTSAVLHSLIGALAGKHLSDAELRGVYERALVMLEQAEAGSPESAAIYRAARRPIEDALEAMDEM